MALVGYCFRLILGWTQLAPIKLNGECLILWVVLVLFGATETHEEVLEEVLEEEHDQQTKDSQRGVAQFSREAVKGLCYQVECLVQRLYASLDLSVHTEVLLLAEILKCGHALVRLTPIYHVVHHALFNVLALLCSFQLDLPLYVIPDRAEYQEDYVKAQAYEGCSDQYPDITPDYSGASF